LEIHGKKYFSEKMIFLLADWKSKEKNILFFEKMILEAMQIK